MSPRLNRRLYVYCNTLYVLTNLFTHIQSIIYYYFRPFSTMLQRYTGWTKRIWMIFRGCLEVTGLLKTYFFVSIKKFMQIPLKVNKVFFLTSSMASQWPLELFFQKVKITPYLCMDSNRLNQEEPWTKETWSYGHQMLRKVSHNHA